MWFWKRKEVWAGFSMEEFNRIRQTLTENRIRYDYRMNNRSRLDFDRKTVTLGRLNYDPRFDTLYYVYVDKDDFERAKSLFEK